MKSAVQRTWKPRTFDCLRCRFYHKKPWKPVEPKSIMCDRCWPSCTQSMFEQQDSVSSEMSTTATRRPGKRITRVRQMNYIHLLPPLLVHSEIGRSLLPPCVPTGDHDASQGAHSETRRTPESQTPCVSPSPSSGSPRGPRNLCEKAVRLTQTVHRGRQPISARPAPVSGKPLHTGFARRQLPLGLLPCCVEIKSMCNNNLQSVRPHHY